MRTRGSSMGRIPTQYAVIAMKPNSPEWHVEQAKLHVERATKVLKQGIEAGGDPQGTALMATASEVLGGLTRAFTQYTHHTDPAWRPDEG